MRISTLPVLSAFTGLGGLDLGLEHAGFRTIACLEVDAAALAALRRNRPDWHPLGSGDVAKAGQHLRPSDLGLAQGELAVLAGGPPCQPFSKAAQWHPNSRTGMDDPRTHSLHGLLAILDCFLPEVLLLENVAGFLRGPSSARQLLEQGLAMVNTRHGTAYELQHRVLDAVDYGVPQRRQRAIAVATRSGRQFRWPAATHDQAPVRCWDVIGGLQEAEVPRPTGRWAGLLPSIPEGKNYQWHTNRGGGEPLFGYRTRYWSFLLKLARDQPSWTLPASPGPSTGPFHWENRPLTTTERLRLQSFPGDWFVPGNRQSQTRLVGNATPPLLAEVIGRAIAEQLFGAELAPVPSLAIQRGEHVPSAVAPTPVPAAYLHLRGRHAAHPGTGLGPAPRSRPTDPGTLRPDSS
jgi:DNA (cytosine-5)-methyltransferase 1